MIRKLCLTLSVFLFFGCSSSPYPHIDFQSWNRTPDCCLAAGKKMAVASGGRHSSKAALEMVKQGGNIVDASIAAAFSLAVERPQSLGLGGGGFMMLSLAGHPSSNTFIDFRETAPKRARKDMFLDPHGKVIPDKSRLGALSIATPGFVPGLLFIHKKWGKLPWSKLIQPAIRLAREGFVVYPSLARRIQEEKANLEQEPYARNILSQEGRFLQKGDWIRQLDLAKTLERIAEAPDSEMTTGLTAKKTAEFIRDKGGILSLQDLSHYRPRVRQPLNFSWNGKTFLLAPPPSAGGVILIELLQMLSNDGLETLAPADYIHLASETMRRAYADRSQAIGDPDFTPLTLTPLLLGTRAQNLRKTISLEKATPSNEIKPISINELKDTHTTHLSLMDSSGNAIAMTLSLNEFFGSRLAVPDTGVFLNNQMDDFSSKPGTPNVFGLIGAEANAIAPLKRPASSMTPTIVLEKEKPVLAIGAAGGSKISTHVLQVVLNLYKRSPADLKRSVFQPRFHHQWLPDLITLEKGFTESLMEQLKRKGHALELSDRTALVQTVWKSPDEEIIAVFDPRDEGGAEAQ